MNVKSRRISPAPHGRMPTWVLVAAAAAMAGVVWLLPVAV
jgi:hypothetical protein